MIADKLRVRLIALEHLLQSGWPRDEIWCDEPTPEALATVIAAVADLEAEGIYLPTLLGILRPDTMN
jgi:hypothetical protein